MPRSWLQALLSLVNWNVLAPWQQTGLQKKPQPGNSIFSPRSCPTASVFTSGGSTLLPCGQNTYCPVSLILHSRIVIVPCAVPGALLGAGDTEMNKADPPPCQVQKDHNYEHLSQVGSCFFHSSCSCTLTPPPPPTEALAPGSLLDAFASALWPWNCLSTGSYGKTNQVHTELAAGRSQFLTSSAVTPAV